VFGSEELGLQLPGLSGINSLLSRGPQREPGCEHKTAPLREALPNSIQNVNDSHGFLRPSANQAHEFIDNNQLSIELQPVLTTPVGYPAGDLEAQFTPFADNTGLGDEFHLSTPSSILLGK
jgi:hypothetical protein